MNELYKDRFNEYKCMIDKYLNSFPEGKDKSHLGLYESMRYSLLSGGKRVRPVLTLEFCRLSGGNPKSALSVACALEMLHTYSLVHDDLPCMDNDDQRRGRPSNHKVYGETVAVLAGDALQAEAFLTILNSELNEASRCECAKILAEAAGKDGICGGQYLDMLGNLQALSGRELQNLCEMKTATMIAAACMMGAVVGEADERQRKAAANFGKNIGLAFQIRDDVLDVFGKSEELGKLICSDSRVGKNTFMSFYGVEKCEAMIIQLTDEAKTYISEAFSDIDFLCLFADKLVTRTK